MSRLGIRFTLGGVMLVIALVGLILGFAPSPLGLWLVLVLSGLAVIIFLLAMIKGISPVRATIWVCLVYPWLPLASLYLTWVAAWIALGHPPRPSLDDPKSISDLVSLLHNLTWTLLFSILPGLIACALLIVWGIVLALKEGGKDHASRVSKLVLIPGLAWGFAYAFLRLDPGGVFNWFAD